MNDRLTYGQIAEIIRERVTMPKLLSAYGIVNEKPTRGWRRIPCPIHKGTDKNFSYSDTGYKCFVCGARGGVVKFVEEYKGLPFRDALREIDALCGLKIPFDEQPPRELSRTLRQTNLTVLAGTLISNIETQLCSRYRAALERFTETGDDGSYDRLMDAQEALFDWESYGRERLREYAAFVTTELEKDAFCSRIWENQKRRMLETAASRWRTADNGTGYLPETLYYPNVIFNKNRNS